MERIAIIDCGTNTFHLLIAAYDASVLTVLYNEKIAVRVGKGGINRSLLLPDAIDRATDALTHFRHIIKKHAANRIHAFATSAFRNATNAEAARASLLQNTGIDIKIISGKEEAAFIFYGVNAALDIGSDPALIMDIGGGSVEFIIGKRDHILWRQSFEIGAQRLLDLFHKIEPIQMDEIRQLEDYLRANLRELLEQLVTYAPNVLIGSSGTFDTLSEIYCKKQGIITDEKATETPLPLTAYKDIHIELLGKKREERMKIPGMIEMRVDMIVVASCLITFLLKIHAFEKIRVSTYALKEGVLDRAMKNEL